MAFVRLAFFPGASLEHYDALRAALRETPAPAERLLFAAGAREGGVQVVQVWASRAALDSFNERWLLPALTRLGDRGFPAPPQVSDFETHDLEIGRA